MAANPYAAMGKRFKEVLDNLSKILDKPKSLRAQGTMLDVNHETLRGWFRNGKNIDAAVFKQIRELGGNPDYILVGNGEPLLTPPPPPAIDAALSFDANAKFVNLIRSMTEFHHCLLGRGYEPTIEKWGMVCDRFAAALESRTATVRQSDLEADLVDDLFAG